MANKNIDVTKVLSKEDEMYAAVTVRSSGKTNGNKSFHEVKIDLPAWAYIGTLDVEQREDETLNDEERIELGIFQRCGNDRVIRIMGRGDLELDLLAKVLRYAADKLEKVNAQKV